MKPEDLQRALQKGTIAPVYYFHGDEPYLIERWVKRVVDAVVPADFRDFNFELFYADDVRVEQIIAACQTLPMFADRRMVLVKRADALSSAALDAVAEYISDPSLTTCLLFSGEKVDGRKKAFATLKKADALVEFKRPYENQLPAFVRSEVEGFGKKINSEAAELLAYLIGNSLQEIASQVEKVCLFAGSRPSVTPDDVRAIVSDLKADSVFDLTNAIGEKKAQKALRSLHTLVRDGQAPLMILAMIARHMRLLWKIVDLQQRKTPEADIPKLAGVSPYFAKGLLTQARKYRSAEMPSIFERLLQTDMQLKSSSRVRPSVLLESLVLDICGFR